MKKTIEKKLDFDALIAREKLLVESSVKKFLFELPNPKEELEQRALFVFAERMVAQGIFPELSFLHAIPNGRGVHVVVRMKMVAEGVKSGVPDIEFPYPYRFTDRDVYTGLHIELKRRHGGELKPAQAVWHDALRSAGRAVFICKGWEAAARVLFWYAGKIESPGQLEDGRA